MTSKQASAWIQTTLARRNAALRARTWMRVGTGRADDLMFVYGSPYVPVPLIVLRERQERLVRDYGKQPRQQHTGPYVAERWRAANRLRVAGNWQASAYPSLANTRKGQRLT
jgi:hypothetical protein